MAKEAVKIIIAVLPLLLLSSCDAPKSSPGLADLTTPTDNDPEDTDADGDSDTGVPSIIGDSCADAYYTCEGDQLLYCDASDNTWVLGEDCTEKEFICDHYEQTFATCLPATSTAIGLNLNLLHKKTINPAGIQVIFSVSQDNGVPIARLQADEITITNDEDGLPFQEGGGQPFVGQAEGFAFYTVLALDMSDSMFEPLDDNNAMEAVAAAKAFIRARVEEAAADKKHNVAVYAFGSEAKSEFVQTFTTDHTILYTALDALLTYGTRGGTNLYGAYIASIDSLNAVGETIETSGDGLVSNSLVLLSDGAHTAGSADTLRTQALNLLEASAVDVYAIALEGDYDEEAIRELASNPISNYFSKDDTQTLEQKFEQIALLTELMADSNYVVGVCSPVEVASSFTITATQGDLSGDLVVTYSPGCDELDPTNCWTGNISECNEITIASN